MSRLIALLTRRVPVLRAKACDPFEHCFFWDPSTCPSPYPDDSWKGCCPSGCVCC